MRAWRDAGPVFALAVTIVAGIWGCGGDDETNTTSDGSGASSSQGSGGSGQGGAGQGGGAQGGGGGSQPLSCSAPTVTSSCGDEGVVRVVVRLGDGMADATGNVQLALAHEALGGGATGGVLHTSTSTPAPVTIGTATSTEIHFDFCAGGEMWSEDNCGFNLWGFLDLDGDTSIDPGEPAGRTFVDVSCNNGGPQCFELVLDCVDGNTCVGFPDPGGTCMCATPSCGSATKIITCI